jgi:hypothetical protein
MIHFGGKQVAGFGISDPIDEFEKSHDPLYDCHHDMYVRLKVIGAAIASSAATLGVLYLLKKVP